jgi:hypothetical protein
VAKARFEWFGVEELIARMESAATIPEMVVIEAHHQAAGGRSAQLNAQIRYVQAANRRDPWFLSRVEIEKIAARVRAASVDGALADRSVLASLAREIGLEMRATYLRHVQEGRGKTGTVRPISERTQKRKEKKGRGANPVLVDSGALLESIALRWRFAG